ncbi:signal transduction histidine kinase [Novosphingobium sp. SG751A]|uniref:sensor histidine kinase n=1 Tax=Novosphingobium sp. SG751A TaxID=2587000 RepID=UPI0015517C2E|nr:signal transduction histidine kinase [Novosphingobium sp. SG751A]
MKSSLPLRARFIIAAGVMIVAVIALTLLVNRAILSNTVTQNLDVRIDTQIDLLQNAIRPDGRVENANLRLLPHFQNAPLQWGWRVESDGALQAYGAALDPAGVTWKSGDGAAIHTGIGRSRAGVEMHVRRKDVVLHNHLYRITVFAPRQLVVEAMDAAITPTQVALALMSVALLVVAYLQLFYSLQPVFRLRDAVGLVREGRLRRLPGGQPRELAPFAAELNALLDQNEAGLEHARHHVGNLAHGLKTPLATLTLKLAREGASAESRALVAEMARRIDHHLNRARAAARSTGDRAGADLGAVAGVLGDALHHLHEGKAIAVEESAAQMLAVDPEDLDEMLGNLLDNACRFARAHVRLSAQAQGAMVAVMVEDDGPGIPPDAIAQALTLGTRLDESGQGYGLGLGIVGELAQLYGGHLGLEPAGAMGGLRAILTLPRRI